MALLMVIEIDNTCLSASAFNSFLSAMLKIEIQINISFTIDTPFDCSYFSLNIKMCDVRSYVLFSLQTQNDRMVSHRMLSHRIAVRNIRNQMSETLCFKKTLCRYAGYACILHKTKNRNFNFFEMDTNPG